MSAEIEIKGHSGGIRIIVLGYENPNATDPSDANWLVCRVQVGIGPFRGEIGAAFTTQDFTHFTRELRALAERGASTASFETDEQALELKIEGKPTRSIKIAGIVRSSSGPDVTVSFALESDQSYLPPILDALDVLMEQFPVRS